MGLRDRIRRVDNRIEKRAKEIARKRREVDRKRRRELGRHDHRAWLRRDRRVIERQLQRLYEEQEQNVANDERDAWLDETIEDLEAERHLLHGAIQGFSRRITAARRVLRRIRKRVRWLVAKNTAARKHLRRLRDKAHVGPEDFHPSMANGDPWEKLGPDERFFIVRLVRSGGYVTSTYEGYPGDGVHTPTSGHYRAEAVDGGHSTYGPMHAFYEAELARGAGDFNECFGPGNRYVKNGVVYQGQFPGHQDHIHEDAR